MNQSFSCPNRRSFLATGIGAGLGAVGLGLASYVSAIDTFSYQQLKEEETLEGENLHDQQAAANEALKKAFARHPLLKNTHIEGYIENRTAALFGTVRSKKQKQIAEELVYELLGASYVKNNLRVDQYYY